MSLEKLDLYIAEGRLTRHEWAGKTEDGRETACLIAALSDDVRAKKDPSACPDSIMPAWLARMTPWMDDSGSKAAWLPMVERYAALAHRWHVLTPERWVRLDYEARAICVREAMRHTKYSKALEVCERVARLCDGVSAGGPIDAKEFESASLASAKSASAWSAAEAAKSASAWSAKSASAWSAASASSVSASAALAAATWSLASASLASSAALAAVSASLASSAALSAAAAALAAAVSAASAVSAAAAEASAADRITDLILNAIDQAVGR